MPFDLFDANASYGLLRQDGLTVSLPKAVRTKRYVLLYLANQWWAPCRGVTAQLQGFYAAHHDTHAFEVIFLSTDRSKEAMLSFFHSAHGDWLCLDYADARRLEAELAADADLHPKQVPACLVFELTHPGQPSADAVSARQSAERDSAAEGKGVEAALPSCAADAGGATTVSAVSFARLVTRHGREMLSKDKDAALFPWYDDGWSDAESVRSAALQAQPRSDEGLSPEKAATPPRHTSSRTSSAPSTEVSDGEAPTNNGAAQQREEAATSSPPPPPPPPPPPASADARGSDKDETNSAPAVSLSSPTSPHLILHALPDRFSGRSKVLNRAADADRKEATEGHGHSSSSGPRRGVILIPRTHAPSPATQKAVDVKDV